MSERFIAALAALLVPLLIVCSTGHAQQAEQPDNEQAVEPPIIIDAEKTDYDLRSGLTRFDDDVNIQRGAMHVKADRGTARQADGRITVVELHGSPTIWTDVLDDGTRVDGEAERIHFNVDANVITLTG
ncbi:MAG: LptA/OstA family protein, partial [Wenzhouxiangellaceae bacterium]